MKLKTAKKDDEYTQDSIPPDWDSMFHPRFLSILRLTPAGSSWLLPLSSMQGGSEDSEMTHLCRRYVQSHSQTACGGLGMRQSGSHLNRRSWLLELGNLNY